MVRLPRKDAGHGKRKVGGGGPGGGTQKVKVFLKKKAGFAYCGKRSVIPKEGFTPRKKEEGLELGRLSGERKISVETSVLSAAAIREGGENVTQRRGHQWKILNKNSPRGKRQADSQRG